MKVSSHRLSVVDKDVSARPEVDELVNRLMEPRRETLTGREIWQMMEENLERTFSCNSYHQMGGYVKRCLGLNVYFKIENPAGARIQELFVHGTPCNRTGMFIFLILW